MEIAFEFKKERKLGEFVQDFINLMKLVLPHFFQTLVKLAIVPLCLMLVLFYYLSTEIIYFTADTASNFYEFFSVLSVVALFLVVVVLFFYGFAIEYFILLKTRNGTDFNAADVWMVFRGNFKKYIKFILIFLLFAVLMVIPVALFSFVLLIIPIIGSFALGIFYAALGVWVFCAFLFYREGYFDILDTFSKTFGLLKKKIAEYGVASYIVNFIFQVLLGMLILMPSILLGIVAYNFVEFDIHFFDSFIGRLIASFGGILITLLFMLYYMFSVLVHGIIYESAKELHFGESMYDKIERLGEGDHAH